jgi:hypothetical protein
VKPIRLSLVALILFFVSTPFALATTFTVDPTSAVDLGGSLTATFTLAGGTTASGTGNIAQQGAGSLHTTLSGFINAQNNGSTLTFLGGSNIAAQPSGNWSPQNQPAAFGFDISVPVFVGGAINVGTVRLIGDIRDLAFDVTGTTPLAGPSGNQLFDTNGLALTTKTGTLDTHGFFCVPGVVDLTQCTDLGTRTSSTDSNSAPDILPPGTGSLKGPSFAQVLSLPIAITASDSQTSTGQVNIGGTPTTVTATFNGTFNVGGNFIAAAIPEASSWVAMCVGLLGLMFALRRGTLRVS